MDEVDTVDTLVREVARIVIESERFPMSDSGECPFGGHDIEGDLGRMHFQRKANADLVEDIQNRMPATGEVHEALFDPFLGHRRERIQERPYGTAGESVDHRDTHVCSGAGGQLHLFCGARADPLRVTIAPDVLGQNGLVPLVDAIANGLTHEVVAYREDVEPVRPEQLAVLDAVIGVSRRTLNVEVVAPARELEAVKEKMHYTLVKKEKDDDDDVAEQIALLKGTLGKCLLQQSELQQSVAGLTKSVTSMQQELTKLVAQEVVDLSPEITKAHLVPGETPQCRCKRLRR